MEILAPAGSPQQLEAALRAGADAVYMGMGAMNARRSAVNFDGDAFTEAVADCHERGVKVYLTLNTLVFDDEMEEARQLFRRACSAGVDGIIVQDIGLARRMRQSAPEMPLHASTQMSIHNPAGLSLLRRMGFCRAVLARELSEQELSEMAASSPLELEVFVHGALCMSVSGQCLMSAVLGGRSGNRGRCAQPCRLPFRAGGTEYCLSLRDNSLMEYIPRLRELGVASLKIEGRMKRPEYCAAAVTACRQARDEGAVQPELKGQLEAVFSRSGFTDGYFTGKRGRAMFGFRTQEDVKAGNAAFAALHELYKNEYQRVELLARFTARQGSPAVLELSDGENTVRCEGQQPLPSAERPLTAERVISQLKKTGGTPYIIKNIDNSGLEDGVFLPASALNALRREATEQLTQKRRTPRGIEVRWQEASYTPHRAEGRELHVVLRSAEQLPCSLPPEVKRVYLPLETDTEQLGQIMRRLAGCGVETAVELQRGIFGAQAQIARRLRQVRGLGIGVCMVHNLGHILPAQETGFKVYGGFGLNVVNTDALLQCEQLGLCGTELSFELTLARTARLGGSLPRAVCIYGYIPLMLTRNCPAALGGKCTGGANTAACSIVDRTGRRMQVRCRGNGSSRCSEIFNTVPVSLAERQSEISGAEHLLLRFTVESPAAVAEILQSCAEGKSISAEAAPEGVTRGMYYRRVE